MTYKEALKKTIEWYEMVEQQCRDGIRPSLPSFSKYGSVMHCNFCKAAPMACDGSDCPFDEEAAPNMRWCGLTRLLIERYSYSRNLTKEELKKLADLLHQRHMEILVACRELL